MYISTLPEWLYHVQAKITFPLLTSLGTVKSIAAFAEAGQLPSKDLATFQVLPPSSEKESWQEPPS